MAKRLLITVRHPGPADFILGLLPGLARCAELHVMATDSALALLLDRGQQVLRDSGARLLAPERVSVGDLERFFRSFMPDVFLRTTPATGIGIDELAPVALRRCGFRGLIHCLQDSYGLGIALRDDEHPVASVGVDAIATVDAAAARLACERMGRTATVVGWASFDKYLTGVPYRQAREAGRRILNIPERKKLVLYAGICSGLPDGNDLLDFQSCLPGLAACSSDVLVAVRTHPRCAAEERAAYASLCQGYEGRIRFQSLDALDDFRQVLAAPDVLLSPASAMNLDALAYAATNDAPATQSVFLTGCCARAAIQFAGGPVMPPTHQPGHGSFLAGYDDLSAVLQRALYSSAERLKASAEAAALYGPDGLCAQRLSAFLGLATR